VERSLSVVTVVSEVSDVADGMESFVADVAKVAGVAMCQRWMKRRYRVRVAYRGVSKRAL
jgi:hypothetical protein